MRYINLASMIKMTEVEGPGIRFAIWVQGCLKQCPDCCNPHMQSFLVKKLLLVEQIFKVILDSKNLYSIEGVTFLGGEPMLQAESLYLLAKLLHNEKLSVMTFTGYTYEEIKNEKLPFALKLFEESDIVVDGPYIKELPEKKRAWCGSTNQRFFYNTQCYPVGLENNHIKQGIEIFFENDQIITIGDPQIARQIDHN